MAANVALPAPPGPGSSRCRRRPSWPRPAIGVPGLRGPADGRGRGRLPPSRPASDQAQEGPRRAPDRARADRGRAQRAGRPAAHRDRCWSASRPSMAPGAVAYGREKLERKRLDAVVVNDIADAGIGFDRLRTRSRSSAPRATDRHIARSGKDQVAAAVLDEVDLLIQRGRDHRAIRADADRAARV